MGGGIGVGELVKGDDTRAIFIEETVVVVGVVEGEAEIVIGLVAKGVLVDGRWLWVAKGFEKLERFKKRRI